MNRRQSFKQFHVTRALRGAVAAGAPSPSVELHLPDGAKIVVNAGGKLDAVPMRKSAPAIRKPVPPPARTPRLRGNP
jgi:hypothetical protein